MHGGRGPAEFVPELAGQTVVGGPAKGVSQPGQDLIQACLEDIAERNRDEVARENIAGRADIQQPAPGLARQQLGAFQQRHRRDLRPTWVPGCQQVQRL